MKPLPPTLQLAALVLWSAPALAIEAAPLVPRVVVLLGAEYRIRRVRRLVNQGSFREAGRVLRVLRWEVDELQSAHGEPARDG